LWGNATPIPTRNPKTRLKTFSTGVGSTKTGGLEFMLPILCEADAVDPASLYTAFTKRNEAEFIQ